MIYGTSQIDYKVSIVTATLNRPSLLDTCESVNSQTFDAWHHFVIGDGISPTDYNHPQRTTIGFSQPIGAAEPAKDKPHGTPNPILRWALQHLHLGKYVCFLDDDNTYQSHFIEEMVNGLENSTAGIAICPLEDYRNEDIHDGYPELGRCDNSGFLTYSKVAKEIGFGLAKADKDNIEDYEFISEIANKYGWIRVAEKLVNFGINPRIPPPADRLKRN